MRSVTAQQRNPGHCFTPRFGRGHAPMTEAVPLTTVRAPPRPLFYAPMMTRHFADKLGLGHAPMTEAVPLTTVRAPPRPLFYAPMITIHFVEKRATLRQILLFEKAKLLAFFLFAFLQTKKEKRKNCQFCFLQFCFLTKTKQNWHFCFLQFCFFAETKKRKW